MYDINLAVCHLALSRLKPVLHPRTHSISLTARGAFVGPASAGKGPVCTPSIFELAPGDFLAKAGPTTEYTLSVSTQSAVVYSSSVLLEQILKYQRRPLLVPRLHQLSAFCQPAQADRCIAEALDQRGNFADSAFIVPRQKNHPPA